MSGPFGWDYPPGCNSTPYDEDQVTDLSPYLTKSGLVGYWTEDGIVHGGHCYDNEGYLPVVGDLVWDDDLSEEDNAKAAAAVVIAHLAVDAVRSKKLWQRLTRARTKKLVTPLIVPNFSQWLESLYDTPAGDFCWDNDEPGDPHVYCCGEHDCKQQWHKIYFAEEIGRKDGKAYVTIRQGDDDGNWDYDIGYEEGDPQQCWDDLYRSMDSRSDEYFYGWASYHLECANSGKDQCEAFSKTATSREHLDAAEDMIDYLAGVSHRTRKSHRKARKAT